MSGIAAYLKACGVRSTRADLVADSVVGLLGDGFRVVKEGDAFIDGEVVPLVRWSDSLYQVNRLVSAEPEP